MMNKQPFISVIIPVYNGEKFLPGCLEALVSGSYRDYELIVVDDCSTDRSVEISREKGAQVLKTSRQSGPGGARNLGAHHARGEVLFFVDADVVVKHDTLERVAANFKDHPEIASGVWFLRRRTGREEFHFAVQESLSPFCSPAGTD